MKNLPDKIYATPNFDRRWQTNAIDDESVEFVRKDAFIEKACEWLSNVSIEHMTYKYNDFDTSEDWYKFIEDFRKYMSL